jgi:hypothetical protein
MLVALRLFWYALISPLTPVHANRRQSIGSAVIVFLVALGKVLPRMSSRVNQGISLQSHLLNARISA